MKTKEISVKQLEKDYVEGLDNEEIEFLKELESKNYHPISEKQLTKEKKFYKKVATNTINKMSRKKPLNLRVYESDIPSIKAIALEKGLPYQTLISSIIHQIATKQIKI